MASADWIPAELDSKTLVRVLESFAAELRIFFFFFHHQKACLHCSVGKLVLVAAAGLADVQLGVLERYPRIDWRLSPPKTSKAAVDRAAEGFSTHSLTRFVSMKTLLPRILLLRFHLACKKRAKEDSVKKSPQRN